MANIIIIDDNIDICQLLERFFKKKGHDTKFFTSEVSALDYLKNNPVDLVFCDFRLPKMDGKEVLEKIKQIDSTIQVVIITGYSDVKTAVDVIKLGAFDYVTKPLFPDEILITMEKALKHKSSIGQDQTVEASAAPGTNGKDKSAHLPSPKTLLVSDTNKQIIVGKSAESKHIQKQIELVAPTNYSVIIYGESGTGKESIAYSIHALSTRKDKPFVAVDCGSLYKELAGSELFGHEKGAFTGALQSKVGQFELANGGTIFLDEIANLSYDIQVSLLRVIQERKIRRLGSQKETPIDVRIIVASNEKITGATSKGTFREDLYHRFNEFSIDLPALRERKNDIMQFAEFFLSNANNELNKQIEGFDEEVEAIFLDYNWPGNLRELNNVIKRAVLLSGKNKITAETLPQEIVFQSKFSLIDDTKTDHKTLPGDTNNLKSIALNAEFEKIVEVLKKVNFNKSKAAQLLNIDRKTLYNKMKIFNLLNT